LLLRWQAVEASSVVVELHECCSRCTKRLRYARQVANEIGLRDWTVQVGHEPPERAEATATAQIATGRKLILLRFHEDEELRSPEHIRHDYTHELTHALVEDLWQTVSDGVRDEFGGAALRIYLGSVQREMERLVDTIATGLAARVPLP
jgi:hypothetical protein